MWRKFGILLSWLFQLSNCLFFLYKQIVIIAWIESHAMTLVVQGWFLLGLKIEVFLMK